MSRPRSFAMLLTMVAMAMLVISTTPTRAQSAVPSAAPSPLVMDTRGWTLESMPSLGFQVLLPPTFERVTGDPTTAVPSIADIDARDPTTANAIIAAAQHIQGDGGLFDGFGLWSVEPATLLQLGIVAGQPYRVATADLEGIVEQSVIERASDLSDPVVQAVSLPAGDGYLASYLDASDLSQHREFHLRTPTGRYIILASSFPGVEDTGTQAMIDAIAASIVPIPGSAGDVPGPDASPGASPGIGAALVASIPASVSGIALTRRALSGEDLVSSTGVAAGAIAGQLGHVVSAPGDVTLALGVPTNGTAPVLISAYRLSGVTTEQVQAFVDAFPASVWSDAEVDGRRVRRSIAGADGTRTWLRVATGVDGTPVLYEVDAGSEALGQAAVNGLP